MCTICGWFFFLWVCLYEWVFFVMFHPLLDPIPFFHPQPTKRTVWILFFLYLSILPALWSLLFSLSHDLFASHYLYFFSDSMCLLIIFVIIPVILSVVVNTLNFFTTGWRTVCLFSALVCCFSSPLTLEHIKCNDFCLFVRYKIVFIICLVFSSYFFATMFPSADCWFVLHSFR